MAYGTYGAPVAAPPSPSAEHEARRIGRIVNAAGALLSISLLAGMGLWSYRLMVRDVSGVPVIQALDGPMRVSPADPGGRQAAYQGSQRPPVRAAAGCDGKRLAGDDISSARAAGMVAVPPRRCKPRPPGKR